MNPTPCGYQTLLASSLIQALAEHTHMQIRMNCCGDRGRAATGTARVRGPREVSGRQHRLRFVPSVTHQQARMTMASRPGSQGARPRTGSRWQLALCFPLTQAGGNLPELALDCYKLS
jgi:hypothetical protein